MIIVVRGSCIALEQYLSSLYQNRRAASRDRWTHTHRQRQRNRDRERQRQKTETKTDWAWYELFNPQSPPPVLPPARSYFLILLILSNSDTPWWLSIHIYGPMWLFLFKLPHIPLVSCPTPSQVHDLFFFVSYICRCVCTHMFMCAWVCTQTT